jgi:hypothetical protein
MKTTSLWEDRSPGIWKLDHIVVPYLTLSKAVEVKEKPESHGFSAVWPHRSKGKKWKKVCQVDFKNKQTNNRKVTVVQNCYPEGKVTTQPSPSLLCRSAAGLSCLVIWLGWLAAWNYSLHKHLHHQRAHLVLANQLFSLTWSTPLWAFKEEQPGTQGTLFIKSYLLLIKKIPSVKQRSHVGSRWVTTLGSWKLFKRS